MLFLHISDIHFKSPDCLDLDRDEDSSIRTLLMRDLIERIGTLGNVDGIFIGGDVAFKAAADEYETARAWIQQLAQITGCPRDRIWTVPGNHDVDRRMIKDSLSIQNAQAAVATAPADRREAALAAQLKDKESGQSLFRPHAAYNLFAAPYGCQIWPDKPFWQQDVPNLGGGVSLRVFGLTSTLLSGQRGGNDEERDLYLSPLQTVLNPAPNTINMVMVHHPIDWLMDGDPVDDRLGNRAMFHLFGHKHKQKAVLAKRYVRLGAGAVNPSRGEKPYDPGYNLISIEVTGEGASRGVDVNIHQRRLQADPEKYVAIISDDGTDVFSHRIALPVAPAIPGAVDPGDAEVQATAGGAEAAHRLSAAEAEASLGQESNSDLLYRFWKLASSQRRKIASKLGLLDAEEMGLPEPERYGRAFIRAGQLNRLAAVETEVAKLEDGRGR